jgi:hypothetical protein
VSYLVRALALCAALMTANSGWANNTLVIRSVTDGFAVSDRNALVLVCLAPNVPDGTDTTGQPGGFLQVVHDLASSMVLGSPDGQPGVSWQWTVADASGSPVELVPAFERWLGSQVTEEYVSGALQNAWVHPETGRGQLLETVGVRVWSKLPQMRSIDLEIRLLNVSDSALTLTGIGLNSGFRVLASPGLQVSYSTLDSANAMPDSRHSTPWLTVTYRDPRRPTYSSVSVLQWAENPGTGLRNGFISETGELVFTLGEDLTLAPGEQVELKYRLYVDIREMVPERLEEAYRSYMAAPAVLAE